MNTLITIKVVKSGKQSTLAVTDGIEKAFSEFDRIVNKFTRFNSESELANLNRRGGKWTKVSEEFIYLIETMLDMSTATNGRFDPTIIDFLEAYGYDSKYDFSKLDNPNLDKLIADLARSRPSWREIKIDSNKVFLALNQRVDLGGIGKGYAIDCASKHLMSFSSFIIDAGGDIYAHGHNLQGDQWQVDLKHSVNNIKQTIGELSLSNQAIAASGSWARKVKNFHHLINPTNGIPSDEMSTVYVLAPNATQADAWATALFVGGKELLAKLPTDLAAMLINPKGEVVQTRNFPIKAGD